MNKRFLAAGLAAVMAMSMVACGKNNNGDTTKTTYSATSTVNRELEMSEYNDFYLKTAEQYSQYVTLGEYKGLSTTVDRSTENVSDDTVQSQIDALLKNTATTTDVTADGTTQNGDTITLDYQGLLDGNAFSGGTATDATYTVGSGKFISDLDTGLAGLKANVETDIPCTFPDNYSSTDLAGKQVIFRVKVTKISRTTTPELTDEWVKNNADAFATYGTASTVAELKAIVKAGLEKTNKETNESTKFSNLLQTIEDASQVSDYPKEELENLENTMKTNVQNEFTQYGSSYGYSDFNAYISGVYGFDDEDAFNKYVTEYAQSYLKEKMIVTLIGQKEGVKVSSDDIKTLGDELAKTYGYSDYNEIVGSFTNEINAEVGYEALYKKVQEIVNAAATEN
jgi:trigger factor